MKLIKTALDTILFDEEEGPLAATLTEGAAKAKVAVIVGDNASGKSLFVKIMASLCHAHKPNKVEAIQVSMKYRTASGMHRAFMYGALGDEMDSTGNVSMIAVNGALKTAAGRTSPHWLMLDEPDTGLSESYARALGTWLAQEFEKLGKETKGIAIVTHSKSLVENLFRDSKLTPWFVHIGGSQTPENWLEDTSERSIKDLLGLQDRSHKLFRAIQARIDKH